ncbi:hypothetical protein AB0I28_29795 [Phytomonospora sp. NPDC050363]|uniref:hypothetical protein n=1 Tax=Phytomonospora sp. NPDC050363 TaxID=3155642 RepID=UPI0033C12570
MAAEIKVDDLEALWRSGAVDLPTVAIQYAEAAAKTHASAVGESSAFSRSEGGMGPLHPVFKRLRDTFQDRVLVRTHDNLISAGRALTKIADGFATTDRLNAAQLNEYADFKTGIETGPAYERPPSVPEAPSSGDPHPEDSGGHPGPN